MELKKTRVLVTGATGGIGVALTHRLADAGAHLILTGRRQEALNRLSAQVQNRTQVINVAADISKPSGRKQILETASSRFSGIDLAVFTAGGILFDGYDNSSEEDIDQLLQLNLIAPMLMSRELINQMRRSGNGQLVFVGSILGAIGMPYYSAYCASKAGLQRFAESLRRELGETDIQITYVAPRATNTALNNDAARAMHTATGTNVDSVKWVADQIIQSITDERDEAYLGWPERFFVKLNAILPRLVDGSLIQQGKKMREFTQSS